jgi:hypothetical protein
MAIGAVTARIITQYSDKGSRAAARDINKLGKNFDKFAGRVAKSFAIAAVASSAFAVKIGKDSIQAAIRAEGEQQRLSQILTTTNGATAEQVKILIAQAEALERVGVVSAGNVSVVQSQLATFDLQAASIQALTPAILDYVTAEKGATASADQFKTMTNGLAQALNGQFGALTRAGFVLDEQTKALISNGTEAERSAAIIKVLNSTYKGFNQSLRDTPEGRIIALNNSFESIKTTIGTALLPAFENLIDLFTTKVIPAIQKFVKENQDKIVGIFTQAIKAVVAFGFAIFKVFSFVAKHKTLFITLGSIFAATFVAGKVIAFVQAIQGLVKAYQAIRAAAIGAAAAQAAATGGISVAAAAAGIAAFTATLGSLYLVIRKANGALTEMESSNEDLEFSYEGLDGASAGFLKTIGYLDVNLGKITKKTKAQLAADAKLIKTQKALAALKKLGIKPTTETDPIQLEAARLNLVRQSNLQEAERVKTLLANLDAQLKANEAIKRYTDLLGVVADSKISPEEVIVLSQKWGISREAVVAYTSAIFAVNDGKISTKEVDALATQWGVTKAQAQTYLDFFAALNDGKLSDEEINKLGRKWNLTNIEVSNYASKIAEGVTPSDLWPTPGNQAAQSWRNALAALNAYVAATGAKIAAPVAAAAGLPSETNLSFKGFGRGGQGTPGTTFPDISPKPIDLSSYVDAFARMPRMADGGIVNSPTAALIGEAGPEAVIPLNRMGSMGGSTVNIVVNGSVTTEGDLVNSIRNAILQGQNNGQAITKTAITL